MPIERKQACRRVRFRPLLVSAAVAACIVTVPWSDTRAGNSGPAINFSVIAAGAKGSRNSCFLLNGTVGQPAPGYSSGGDIALIAGFGAVLPTTNLDEIFFTGFEDCAP